MNQSITTTETFDLHPAVALSLIKSQADSLKKSLCEAVMNSADAHGTQVMITITNDRITINDNGEGFADMDAIDNFFSRIGTPHQEGDAEFGRFRLGRCQLFAYGRNTWKSNTFKMEVDVAHRGINHSVFVDQPFFPSCSIEMELYDKLSDNEILQLIHELKQAIKWISIAVTVNGVSIVENKSKIKWTVETDDAWIQTTEGYRLDVYNQGVFVKSLYSNDLGYGGCIVTKKPLETNAARNDILDTSKTWIRILQVAKKNAPERKYKARNRKSESIDYIGSPENQTAITRHFLAGEKPFLDLIDRETGLFQTACRAYANIRAIASPFSGILFQIEEMNPEAEIVEKSQLATAITRKTLTDFRVKSPQELITLLINMGTEENLQARSRKLVNLIEKLQTVRFATAADFAVIFDQNYAEVSESILTNQQARGLTRLRALSQLYAAIQDIQSRPIIPAISQTRESWTDGKTIWFNTDAMHGDTFFTIMHQINQIIAAYCSTEDNRNSIFPGKDEAEAFNTIMTTSDIAASLLAKSAAISYEFAAKDGKSKISDLSIYGTFNALCDRSRAS